MSSPTLIRNQTGSSKTLVVKNISPSNRKPGKKLFVNHFGSNTISVEYLKNYFSQFGSVGAVSNRGCAFIEFSTIEEATIAFEATQNSKILGNDISVTYSQKDVVERDYRSGYARQNFQIRRPSNLSRPIQALWDWENCGIPGWYSKKGDPGRMVDMIAIALSKLNYDLVRIDGYGHPSSLSASNYLKLQNKGIVLHDVIPLTQEQKERGEADMAIRKAMISWMTTHNPPAPVILITSDRDYVKTIRLMKKRGFEVIVAFIPNMSSSELKNAGHKGLSWYRILEGKT